jgi:hypothetical protein
MMDYISKYIHAPTNDGIQDIIETFRDATRISNTCGDNNGTHIPSSRRLASHITPWASHFFNNKEFSQCCILQTSTL